MRKLSFLLLCVTAFVTVPFQQESRADYYATAHTGQIFRFTQEGTSLNIHEFAFVGPGQLSGLVYDATSEHFYASMLNTGEIYRIDLAGNVVGTPISTGTIMTAGSNLFAATGFAPSGLAFDSHGALHVAALDDANRLTPSSVYKLEGSSFIPVGTYTPNPEAPLPPIFGGVGFLANGQMVVSSVLGEPFAGANAQIAVAPGGQSYFVGSTEVAPGVGAPTVLSSVFELNASGAVLSSIEITDAMLPDDVTIYLGTPTNPAGVAFDPDGNLIVSVLGANPYSSAQGGLILLDPSNQDVLATWHGPLSLSNVVWAPTAVPEPSSMALLLLTGLGGAARYWSKRKKVGEC